MRLVISSAIYNLAVVRVSHAVDIAEGISSDIAVDRGRHIDEVDLSKLLCIRGFIRYITR